MPGYNRITGQGTPPPPDSSYPTINLTESEPPLEAADPATAGPLDGVDMGSTSVGGGRQPVDASQFVTPPNPGAPPPEPPPYEPAPGTNPLTRAVVKAVDFVAGQHGNLKDLAKAVDSRVPFTELERAMNVGNTLGKDLATIVGPDPGKSR